MTSTRFSNALLAVTALAVNSVQAWTLLTLTGCQGTSQPTPVGPRTSNAQGGAANTVGGPLRPPASVDPARDFKDAGAVKVIFNKQSFFNNYAPNSKGCAGDAKDYFDPFTDRRVPTKPDWLKNVAVDITNSNASFGASRASACSLSGIGTASPSNCASFDDNQPLNGLSSRSVLVGGYGCRTGSASCPTNHVLADIWKLTVPDIATGAAWLAQSGTLPAGSTPSNAATGSAWHGADFDEIHNEFYLYGGTTPDSSLSNSTQVYSDRVIKFFFNGDSSVSTSPGPSAVTGISNTPFYAGWATSAMPLTLLNVVKPPPMTGASFTYGLRRDPTSRAYCRNGDGPCTSPTKPTNTPIAVNEHHDYFLLAGGLSSVTRGSEYTAGHFSQKFLMYMPHRISPDASTNTVVPGADGHWNIVSNHSGLGKVMSVVDITTADVSSTFFSTSLPPHVYDFLKAAADGMGSALYVPTFVGGTRPQGDVFSGWVGRGYHRTAYDPGSNRFFIFGGLQNRLSSGGSPRSAFTTTPDLATNDIWIYEPPAVGRRPTSTCFTENMPDSVTAIPPSTAGAASVLGGATRSLGVHRNYFGAKHVFPPGGCLQRIHAPKLAPPPRFEHAMAFDRDGKMLLVFGGCNVPSTIPDSGAARAGDPIAGCVGSGSLYNDTWLYLPPITSEIFPKDFSSTAVPGPFNTNTLLGNVFGTDFWLDRAPYFVGAANNPIDPPLVVPPPDAVLGTWIKLSPSLKPEPRAAAAFIYDRAHRKFYLQGGWGCTDGNCSTGAKALSDFWEFTPPDPAFCNRQLGICTTPEGTTLHGSWTKLRPDLDATADAQPTQRYGATMVYTQPMYSQGDEFYTVTDSSCFGQGPIASADASISKQLVGAIYVDIDRSLLPDTTNLVINLRFLAYDKKTKLPGLFDGNTPNMTIDDVDEGSVNDIALIRVQLLSNPLKFADQIQASVQPRFHEFISGTPVIGDTAFYVSGPTGQFTEKQIHIPLTLDKQINLIKIERVQGSVKFFEMIVSKF